VGGDIASPSSVLRSHRPQTRLETSCTRTGRPRRIGKAKLDFAAAPIRNRGPLSVYCSPQSTHSGDWSRKQVGIGSNGVCDRGRVYARGLVTPNNGPNAQEDVLMQVSRRRTGLPCPKIPAPEGSLRAWTQPTDPAHRLTARVDQRIVIKISAYRIRPT